VDAGLLNQFGTPAASAGKPHPSANAGWCIVRTAAVFGWQSLSACETRHKVAAGSHRKFTHPKFIGALSGDGDDAKHYQEKQVKSAIEEVKQ